MVQRKPVTLLIVDDSRIFRHALEALLEPEEDVEVIGSVWNGLKALEFIEKTRPDLVILDYQMPELDGLGTLREIKKINRSLKVKIGVIMISAHSRKGADITLKALEMGAFEFIAKPDSDSLARNITVLYEQLIGKIRAFSRQEPTALSRDMPVPLEKTKATGMAPQIRSRQTSAGSIRAILIGVSTGGPKALMEIMPPLCDRIEIPILIAQHMPATFTLSLAKSLDSKCSHQVLEAADRTIIKPSHVYIAPGGRHTEVVQQGEKILIRINDAPSEQGCRPSVNVLFQSGARVYGGDVLAVILTGMGEDGTQGAAALKDRGAMIIAQDEASSVVWGMPGSAYRAGVVDRLVPLSVLPETITEIINRIPHG